MKNIILVLSVILGMSACKNEGGSNNADAIKGNWRIVDLSKDRSDTLTMSPEEKQMEAQMYAGLMTQFNQINGQIEFLFTDTSFTYTVPNGKFNGKWTLLKDTVVMLEVEGSPENGYLNIQKADEKNLHLFDSSIGSTMIFEKITE